MLTSKYIEHCADQFQLMFLSNFWNNIDKYVHNIVYNIINHIVHDISLYCCLYCWSNAGSIVQYCKWYCFGYFSILYARLCAILAVQMYTLYMLHDFQFIVRVAQNLLKIIQNCTRNCKGLVCRWYVHASSNCNGCHRPSAKAQYMPFEVSFRSPIWKC